MTDPAVLPSVRTTAEPGSADPGVDDLTSLRSILIGPAERKLQAIEARLDDRFSQARDIAAVLPQALQQRAGDAELARALTPPVERAITDSVRRDPKPLADALFPVIGPAIRKAVAATLASMMDSLSRTVEQSVSWRAIQWRLEAARTGKPFGEIVLLHTLLYRVEQVFLIHRQTGLLLQHVRAGGAQVEDGQLVSAMLTAIRDFVHDSFRISADESLDTLNVGELTVWVEQGPAAVLAAVVRGSAPPERRQLLAGTLETIHLQFGNALLAFSGDSAVFDRTRPLLEQCLGSELRPAASRRGRGIVAGMLLLVLLGLGLWGFSAWREQRRWNAYVEALRREPGLVVISTDRRDGKRVVSGLRDPLARDPAGMLAQAQLASEDVTGAWEPYQSFHPGFVLSRANRLLQAPPGVTFGLHGDGVLIGHGSAPAAWITEAVRLAPLIPGVSRFDPAGVMDARIRSLTGTLGDTTLLFERGRSRLLPEQDQAIQRIGAAARELGSLASLSGRSIRIDIIGHTDADGDSGLNVPLSRERAARALLVLGLQDTASLSFATLGVGSGEPQVEGRNDADKQRNRRVSFRVSPISPTDPVVAR